MKNNVEKTGSYICLRSEPCP